MGASSSTQSTGDVEPVSHSILDTIGIQMPGGQTINLSDNARMLDVLTWQCPKWEQKGNVSSIPIARIPRVFLHNTQMSKDLQRQLKFLQKGETGEIKIYNLLTHSQNNEQEGMIVFPNVNGHEIFKKFDSKVADVEIDMIIAHATKGFFVFNIKNQSGKGPTPQSIQKDIDRHCKFVQCLVEYAQMTSVCSVPIYPVLCLLHDDQKGKFESLSYSGVSGSRILVFGKNELKPQIFAEKWSRKLGDLPDIEKKEPFHVSVARLIALSLIEGSAASIHKKMHSNFLQSLKNNQNQFRELEQQPELGKLLENNMQSKFGNKTKHILWTEEQVKVISTVISHLQNPEKKGFLRLIVTGCKGSGKTMLLVFLAKVAQELLCTIESHENSSSKVLVCNGHFPIPSLFTGFLKEQFESTDVTVFEQNGKRTKKFSTTFL